MANHGQYPAGEVYTIGQVAKLTGASADTIRSWERRFGVPTPTRGRNGQRRYTSEDVRFVSILHRQRESGRTMEQAIHDARGDVDADPVGVATRAPTGPTKADSLSCDDLVTSLTDLDFAMARQVVGPAIVGCGTGTVALELLHPAWVALERLDLEGYVAPGRVRVGISWLNHKLNACLDAVAAEYGRRPSVLVAASHDAAAESLGLAMSCCLAEAGFGTVWAGTDLGPSDIDSLIGPLRPDAIVLVAGSQAGAIATRAAASRLMNPATEPAWRGIVGVAGIEDDLPSGVIRIPIRAREAVATIERALHARPERTGATGEP